MSNVIAKNTCSSQKTAPVEFTLHAGGDLLLNVTLDVPVETIALGGFAVAYWYLSTETFRGGFRL